MTTRDTELIPCEMDKKALDEHQKQRRRALQARHRATLASLFDSLKTVVCPGSKKNPAKVTAVHLQSTVLHKIAICRPAILPCNKPCDKRERRAPNSCPVVWRILDQFQEDCFCFSANLGYVRVH